MFEKVDVNGSNTHPVYKWLKSKMKRPGYIFGKSDSIRWNFGIVSFAIKQFREILD